tara:strand:+ start:11672 stop:12076 length:405 start_codon:yes stop_codon:yes gene_type:complete
MHNWKNTTTGEVITREAHALPEDKRCWNGPQELSRQDGVKYFRYIMRDNYSADVQRLGNMTRMDVMVTVCVTKRLPVNVVLDPLYHGSRCIRAKMLEIYPDLPELVYTHKGEPLVCADLLNGDIIYAHTKDSIG